MVYPFVLRVCTNMTFPTRGVIWNIANYGRAVLIGAGHTVEFRWKATRALPWMSGSFVNLGWRAPCAL